MEPILREKPDTLKGKLQRGHGAGYLEAIQTSRNDVSAILIDCICNDARLDRQFDSRSRYYASLVIKTRTDISCISEYLRQHDDFRLNNGNMLGVLLILSILGDLASKGNCNAVQILRDYILYGYNWCCAVSALVETKERKTLEEIDRAICCRYKNDDDLIKAIDAQYYVDMDFFDFMRQSNTRLAKIANAPIFEDWNPNTPETENNDDVDYAEMSLKEAFDRCDENNRIRIARYLEPKLTKEDVPFLGKIINSGTDCQKAIAAYCMGEIGTVESFSCLKDFIEDISLNLPENASFEQRSKCGQAIRKVAHAPAEVCLETGRKWFYSDNYPENAAGRMILEKHAAIDDIPMLKRAIVDSLENEEKHAYRLCSAIDALGNFEDIGLIPEVEQAYHEAIDSHARRRAAETMCINAPVEFSATYAYECLYDCEGGTRLIGIEMVNIAEPGAYQRLSELAEDSLEDEDVRTGARERLS